MAVKVVGAVMLAAATLSVAASAAAASSGSGWVQLAHLSPNTPPVDVYLYPFGAPKAVIVLRHVAYCDESAFQRVPSGEYTVAMRAAGSPPGSPPTLSTSLDVMPGGAYTVVGLGPASRLRLQVLRDKLTAPRGKVLIRVIAASLRQPHVTVTADGRVVARALALGGFSGYRAVRPGRLTVRAAGATATVTATRDVPANAVYMLAVIDGASGHLAIDYVQEAAGSRIRPAGGVPAGLGGTAARPGRPLLPWLVTGIIGLAAIACGYLRIWWPRPRALHAR